MAICRILVWLTSLAGLEASRLDQASVLKLGADPETTKAKVEIDCSDRNPPPPDLDENLWLRTRAGQDRSRKRRRCTEVQHHRIQPTARSLCGLEI
eukprot:s705_g8.t1